MKTVMTAGNRYLSFVSRCTRCGVKLNETKSYLTEKYPWVRYHGNFCLDCALGLIPELVALIGGSKGAYGIDFMRYDVRCGRCGLVGEFGCRAT